MKKNRSVYMLGFCLLLPSISKPGGGSSKPTEQQQAVVASSKTTTALTAAVLGIESTEEAHFDELFTLSSASYTTEKDPRISPTSFPACNIKGLVYPPKNYICFQKDPDMKTLFLQKSYKNADGTVEPIHAIACGQRFDPRNVFVITIEYDATKMSDCDVILEKDDFTTKDIQALQKISDVHRCFETRYWTLVNRKQIAALCIRHNSFISPTLFLIVFKK